MNQLSNAAVFYEAGSVTGRCCHQNGDTEEKALLLISEHKMHVQVSETGAYSFVCTKHMLQELIGGHLIGEGWIDRFEDIQKITFFKEETEAVVSLHTRNDSQKLLNVVDKREFNPQSIYAAAKMLEQGFENYKATGGIHSCQLWVDDNFVHVFEDIGRHNTLDKAIGYIYHNNLEPERCMLFCSFRVHENLVKKLIRSRIPILATKALPTQEALKLAHEYGITLIGRAKTDSFLVL